jgi:hypothetical protein
MGRREYYSFLVASLVALLAARSAFGEEGWQRVTVKDGVTVDRRPVPGSKIYETRAMTSSPLTPAQIFAVIWDRRAYPEFVPYIKRQDILEERGDEVLLYDQVRVPLVADRDYVVRTRREIDAASQVHRILFHSADPEGPPPQKGHVRVRNIRGSWDLRPSASGGTDVTYMLHSDPGGHIPSWIVNLVQKKEVPRFLRLMLDRALKKSRG